MIETVLSRMLGKKVLVIGDMMLDKSIYYTRVRESGEFDGPVLRELDRTFYAGGAANVALNCKSLGATVTILGVFGTDLQGRHLGSVLQSHLIRTPTMTWDSRNRYWNTTTKTRVYIEGKPAHRIDQDYYQSLDLNATVSVIRANKFDLLLLSDYQKGMFSDSKFLQTAVAVFREVNPYSIVAANPKPKMVMDLPHMDLVSVNQYEYKECKKPLDSEWVIHTVGAGGLDVLYCSNPPGSRWNQFPILGDPLEDPDVVGCGDAVFAAASLALCVSPEIDTIGRIAVAAGTAKAKKKGTATVCPRDIVECIEEMVCH